MTKIIAFKYKPKAYSNNNNKKGMKIATAYQNAIDLWVSLDSSLVWEILFKSLQKQKQDK